jgi:lipoyl(octanoyl) transferase
MVNSPASSALPPRLGRGDILAATSLLPRGDTAPVDWRISDDPVPYPQALAFMDARVAAIAAGEAPECVWLLEHPPLYTAGTSARPADLVDPERFPVYATGRGGQYTYHGPGQRIAYVMLDLKRRAPDVRAPDLRAYVAALEEWLIRTLWRWHVRGERRDDRVGIWVRRPDRPAPPGEIAEDKIAALGIRVRHGVTLHGVSLNVEPDLTHFAGIVPCGIADHGVTSLADLGLTVAMPEVDVALRQEFAALFGPTRRAA